MTASPACRPAFSAGLPPFTCSRHTYHSLRTNAMSDVKIKQSQILSDKFTVSLTTLYEPFFLSFFLSLRLPTHCRCRGYCHWSRSATHTTLGSTPLDEWSARRRDLYLTTHNNHDRQTPMSPAGFEPAIPASEGPQTHASDRAATSIGSLHEPQSSFCRSDRETSWHASTTLDGPSTVK